MPQKNRSISTMRPRRVAAFARLRVKRASRIPPASATFAAFPVTPMKPVSAGLSFKSCRRNELARPHHPIFSCRSPLAALRNSWPGAVRRTRAAHRLAVGAVSDKRLRSVEHTANLEGTIRFAAVGKVPLTPSQRNDCDRHVIRPRHTHRADFAGQMAGGCVLISLDRRHGFPCRHARHGGHHSAALRITSPMNANSSSFTLCPRPG